MLNLSLPIPEDAHLETSKSEALWLGMANCLTAGGPPSPCGEGMLRLSREEKREKQAGLK